VGGFSNRIFFSCLGGLTLAMVSWLVLPFLICLGHGDVALAIGAGAFGVGALVGLVAPDMVREGLGMRDPAQPPPSPEEVRTAKRYAQERARIWRRRRATVGYAGAFVLAVVSALAVVVGILIQVFTATGVDGGLQVVLFGFGPAVLGLCLPFVIVNSRRGGRGGGPFDVDAGSDCGGGCGSCGT
jgi:hypothetical protein